MRTTSACLAGRMAVVGAIMGLSIASAGAATGASSVVKLATPQAVLNTSGGPQVSLASCCDPSGCTAGCCVAPSEGCCNSCGVCDSGCGWLGADWGRELWDHVCGFPAPSDRCFDCFISPMTNPIYFEDPRTLTEARFIYFHHKLPINVGGGDIDLFALQLRAALTDRLSVIATKDGFATSSNPLIDDGWADINIGLKYNWIRDPERQFLYTVGATYELPVGSTRTLQGNGDGTFHLFSTGAKRIFGWNGLLAHGWIIPADDVAESEWFYFSSHLSRKLGSSNFYFLAEVNWYNWLQSGGGGIPGVEGLDVINLGSTNVTGNDIVTGAFGVKYKPRYNVELGVAWENPLTERRDILENRLTFDCILRY